MYHVVTPPAYEPVSLAQLKAYLRIDWTDDDYMLANSISAARQMVEKRLGRALITQTLQNICYLPEMVMTPLSGVIGNTYSYAIELPQAPLQAVSLVEIEAQISQWNALTVTTDYIVDVDFGALVARVFLATSALAQWAVALTYPGQKPRVRTTYTAGYGDTADTIPWNITQNVLNAAAYLYENRGTGKAAIPDELFDESDRIWRL